MSQGIFQFARTIGRQVWPLADQALIAAVSFLTMVLLARQLSVEAFGAFTLVYSLIYFANSMQSGLVTQPHNVLGAIRIRGQDRYVVYTTSTAVGQLALALASAGLALAGWAIARLFDAGVASLLMAAAPAIFAWQMQEFVRRVLYTEQRIAEAFANDVLAYGAQAVGLALLWRGEILSGASSLYVLSGTFALASIAGAWQIRGALGKGVDWAILWENWDYGKWVAGGTILGEWLSAQMLVFLAAAALGAAAAGVLRAVHTLFGPARILAQAFNITLPTRLAVALNDHGRPAMNALFRRALLAATLLLGGYCLLAALLARPLLEIAFGQKYLDYAGVLKLYALSALLTYLCMLGTAMLRALRQTRAIFVSEVIYLLVIPVGALLIPIWNIHGLVVGLIAGDVAALLYIGWACTRSSSQQAGRDIATPADALASAVPPTNAAIPQGAMS